MKKRLLTVLLAVCLVVALGTVTAMADEGDVASIGSDTFNTVQQAINAAEAGDTITLIRDATETGLAVSAQKSITIDLSTHNLTINGRVETDVRFGGEIAKAAIYNQGTLTITNGTITDVSSRTYDTIINVGTLTLNEDVEIVSDTNSNALVNVAGSVTTYADIKNETSQAAPNGNKWVGALTTYGGDLSVLGGKIVSNTSINGNYSAAITVYNSTGTNAGSGATVTIANVEIESQDFAISTNNIMSGGSEPSNVTLISGNIINSRGTAIYWPSAGELIVGEIDADDNALVVQTDTGSAIEICSGTLVVNSGTFIGSDSNDSVNHSSTWASQYKTNSGCAGLGDAISVIARRGAGYNSAPLNVEINGGTFKSDDNYGIRYFDCNLASEGDTNIEQSVEVSIKGGTFTGSAGDVDFTVLEEGDKKIIVGGTFTKTNVSSYIPIGAALSQDEDGTIVTDEDAAVAEIDGVPYTSLNAAIANVKAGETITVTKDIPNATGISVPSGSDFTIDFGGHTYTLSGPGAGSTNTETNGFQLLKGSTIVFKNGTIRIAENANNIKRIIQNYANLTLEDMHIYAENQVDGEDYALSFNCGNITFKGDTDVITTNDNTVAFDVCYWKDGGYTEGVKVAFDDDYTGTINGVILYDSTDKDKAVLTVNGNGYIGDIVKSVSTENGQAITVSGGTFGDSVADVAVTPDYELVSGGEYTYYTTLSDAMAAANDGDTINFVGDKSAITVHTVTFVNNGVKTTVEVTDSITLPNPDSRNGYTFGGWRYGNTVYKAGETVTINSNTTFTAIWNAINIPDTYDIDLVVGEGGEAKTNFSNASAGTTITITVTPDEGYELDYITVDGERISGTSFKMPDHDVTVRVYFTDGTSSLPFTDVSAGQWFYDAVAYVYTNGMMEGDSATTFNPDGTMTRAMFWAVLGRIDGATITGTNWADQAREWAMAEGVSDGTDPNGLVTREQMVTMLWRYAGEPESSASLSAYTDADSVSDWAETAMRWAIDEGIITGMTDTTLVPQGTATRAQCAAIFMRFDQM